MATHRCPRCGLHLCRQHAPYGGERCERCEEHHRRRRPLRLLVNLLAPLLLSAGICYPLFGIWLPSLQGTREYLGDGLVSGTFLALLLLPGVLLLVHRFDTLLERSFWRRRFMREVRR